MWNYIIAGYLIGCIIALIINNKKEILEEIEKEYPVYNPKFIAAITSIASWVIVIAAVAAMCKQAWYWVQRKLAKIALDKIVRKMRNDPDTSKEVVELLDKISDITNEI